MTQLLDNKCSKQPYPNLFRILEPHSVGRLNMNHCEYALEEVKPSCSRSQLAALHEQLLLGPACDADKVQEMLQAAFASVVTGYPFGDFEE